MTPLPTGRGVQRGASASRWTATPQPSLHLSSGRSAKEQSKRRVCRCARASCFKALPLPDPPPPFILFSSFLTRGGREGEAGERWSAQIFWQKPRWRRARNDLMTGVRFGSAITLCFPILQGIQICN